MSSRLRRMPSRFVKVLVIVFLSGVNTWVRIESLAAALDEPLQAGRIGRALNDAHRHRLGNALRLPPGFRSGRQAGATPSTMTMFDLDAFWRIFRGAAYSGESIHASA